MNGKKCIGLSVLVLVGVAGAPAAANQIFVNPAPTLVQVNSVDYEHSRHVYRLQDNRWDMRQASQSDVNGVPPGPNLGHQLQLASAAGDLDAKAFTFSLFFDQTDGFTFKMNEIGGSIEGTLIWGPDPYSQTNPAPANSSVRSELGGRTFDHAEFNAIRLGTSGSDMQIQGFQFHGPDGPLSFDDASSPPASAQWLYSEGNLLDLDNWMIQGTVIGNSGGGATLPDFRISMHQVQFAVIPLPTGAGLAGLGLGLVALRRRR